jgi:serine/threonine-protein kinase
MGEVYRAHDPAIGSDVAIKVLRVNSEDLQSRFRREARSAGNLRNHPNIVTIYDFGEHEGHPFIVMQYVEGKTLAEVIRQRIDLSLARKLQLMDMLASGLEFAHRRGIIHRDIKPANLMIDGDGTLKILDFGIARVGESGATQVGMIVGTPNYMSPEQIEGLPVDQRSDIFAVGLVFYELLTYRQAFPGDSTHGVLDRILKRAPEPLSDVCPGIDPAIEAIVNRTLAKDFSRRYPDLGVFKRDLDPCRARAEAGNAADSVPTLAGSVFPVVGRRTPRHGTDRELLSRRRADQIDAHLKTAASAFDAGDYETAIDACEKALILDPDEPVALNLLERARENVDRKRAATLLHEAEESLGDGDLSKAETLIDQALQLDAGSTDALILRRRLDNALDERRRAEERQRIIVRALASARTALDEGAWDDAVRSANEALLQDPSNTEARDISRRATAAINERQAREVHEQNARAAVAHAMSRFAAGQHAEAIAALRRFAPAHSLVDQARGDLEQQLATIERERQDRELRERERAEAERRRAERERWIQDRLASAKNASEQSRFEDAINVLTEILRTEPANRSAADMLRAVEQRQAVARTEAARIRRQPEQLRRAQQHLDERNYADAFAELDTLLRDDPAHAGALTLRTLVADAADRADLEARQQAEAKRIAEERQNRINQQSEQLGLAQQQLDGRNYAKALAAVDAVLREEPSHSTALGLRRQIMEAAERAEREAREQAEAKRIAEERQNRINQQSEQLRLAQQQLDGRNYAEALAAVDAVLREEPSHSTALGLRRQIMEAVERAEREARERAEAKRIAEERQQRVNRQSEQLRLAQQQLDGWKYSEALATIDTLLREEPTHATALSLRRYVTAAAERAEREAREHAEAKRLADKRQQQVDRLIQEGRHAIVREEFTLAIERATRVLQIDSRDARARDIQMRAEEALARRAAQAERDRAREGVVASRVVSNNKGGEAAAITVEAPIRHTSLAESAPVAAPAESSTSTRWRREAVVWTFSPALRFVIGVTAVVVLAVAIKWWPRQPTIPATDVQPTNQEVRSNPLPNLPPAEPRDGRAAEQSEKSAEQRPERKSAPDRRDQPTGLSRSNTALGAGSGGSPSGDTTRDAGAYAGSNPGPGPGAQGNYGPAGGPVNVLPNGGGVPNGGPVPSGGGTFPLPGGNTEPVNGNASVTPRNDTELRTDRSGDANSAVKRAENDKDSITRLLDDYVKAYDALDVAAIARLVPGAKLDPKLYRSYQVTLTNARITVDGDFATATCQRNLDAIAVRANTPLHDARSITFKMRRAGDSWRIESVQ